MQPKMTSYTRMSWNRIKELFAGEWVELVDFDWEWSSSFPRAARIRNHASDRSELMSLVEAQGRGTNSVILFVGAASSFVNRESSIAAL
jgi:hypothetical protein